MIGKQWPVPIILLWLPIASLAVILLLFFGLGYFFVVVTLTHWIAGVGLVLRARVARGRAEADKNRAKGVAYSSTVLLVWGLIGAMWTVLAAYTFLHMNFPLIEMF